MTIAHSLDLTALIGSRICHDLISPLGAIGNGVELLGMNGAPQGPEMALISQSVENANARIRFFRVSFGAESSDQTLGTTEIASILSDINHEGRLVFDWQPKIDLPRQQVKLAFLLLQCFENAMPFGGNVTVCRVGDQWALTGEAEKLSINADLWELLTNPSAEVALDAAQVQFALAPITANSLDRSLIVESSQTKLRVRF